MPEQRYNVLVNDECIAKDMSIETAMMLEKAVFETYYAEAAEVGMLVTIEAVGRERDADGM